MTGTTKMRIERLASRINELAHAAETDFDLLELEETVDKLAQAIAALREHRLHIDEVAGNVRNGSGKSAC